MGRPRLGTASRCYLCFPTAECVSMRRGSGSLVLDPAPAPSSNWPDMPTVIAADAVHPAAATVTSSTSIIQQIQYMKNSTNWKKYQQLPTSNSPFWHPDRKARRSPCRNVAITRRVVSEYMWLRAFTQAVPNGLLWITLRKICTTERSGSLTCAFAVQGNKRTRGAPSIDSLRFCYRQSRQCIGWKLIPID